MKIGLFYGSTTCYTEMAAEKIRACLGHDLVDLHNVKTDSLDLMSQYDVLILGISTWDFGELQEDWAAIWQDIDALDLKAKPVALFGLGDQEGYGEWYLDAMGLLHQQVCLRGATPMGYWPSAGYEFEASKALTDDGTHFVGLALDEDSQYELSDARIEQWCEQILIELHELL